MGSGHAYEHNEASARLALLNYHFVSLNADAVFQAIKKDSFLVTLRVKKILSVFNGPECSLESAAGVLAEVSKRFWLERLLYEHKIDLLDQILDSLCTNRPINQVVESFSQAIEIHFFLVSNMGDAIRRYIQLWKKQKLSRSGVLI